MPVCFHCGLLVWLCVAVLATCAQAGPGVELSADLLDLFKPDRAHDALSCEVRRPGSADGVKEDALLEHPLAPGFAALLWLDSQLAEQPDASRRSRERVRRAAQDMLRDAGPGLFTSQANCHNMQWEFPFLYGCLPDALSGLDGQIRQLIQTQRPDGGWVYQLANALQSDLGRSADSVLGTCANRAATLLRYARITGDATALGAGEKALRFMEQFHVPRGGQNWGCPMYEPDILAAAYAVHAYHDGYRATANPRWLHAAVYWAETGVPFIYLWSLPDKPMMLGSTIPGFGSTFYTHSWLGVPVQLCGLVYAYHVFHLAREAEQAPLAKTDSLLPLALNFSPVDWRRIVERAAMFSKTSM